MINTIVIFDNFSRNIILLTRVIIFPCRHDENLTIHIPSQHPTSIVPLTIHIDHVLNPVKKLSANFPPDINQYHPTRLKSHVNPRMNLSPPSNTHCFDHSSKCISNVHFFHFHDFSLRNQIRATISEQSPHIHPRNLGEYLGRQLRETRGRRRRINKRRTVQGLMKPSTPFNRARSNFQGGNLNEAFVW